MNIAYLIGNGFDIALGLKTKYSDFYQYYVKRETNSELIRRFKKALEDDLTKTGKWSDIELELGQYLENFQILESSMSFWRIYVLVCQHISKLFKMHLDLMVVRT